MRKLFYYTIPLAFMLTSSCKHSQNFSSDLGFLQKHDNVIVLAMGESKIIISPKYQAKVFTSTADGESSFGWINYKAFDGPLDPHMNAYGGENRLWLGPEGGKFSLFFAKDTKMEFPNWKTPIAFDSDPWNVTVQTGNSVRCEKQMLLKNYAGTLLAITVTRDISILDRIQISAVLGLTLDPSVKSVGYETDNMLTNNGTLEWSDTTGMPCLWVLDMLRPSDHTTIVIPYTDQPGQAPATTNYFGEILPGRINYQNNTLFFKADGKSRGKLGIHPECAKNIAGSYDAENKVLTISVFDIDNKARYLNQEWNTTKAPFSGDAVNAYNDGPLADGKQMGPFYELESVSPAEPLQPGASLTHKHSVFHFTGDENALNTISQKVLGVSIEQIKSALK